jgi:hypothetical protein
MTTAAVICGACGKSVKMSAGFCGSCGAVIRRTWQEYAPVSAAPVHEDAPRLRLPIAVSAALLLTLICCMYFL